MNIVVSDPKGKSYSLKTDNPAPLLGKKIGDPVPLDEFGLAGFVGQITGGSDKDGFPMRKDLAGSGRRKVLISVDERIGMRKRLTRRANQIAADIHQVNIKITQHGQQPLSEILGKKEEAAPAPAP
ncbi:MAG: 30S ribosomal protein S6e [Candidatus Diapherotrites archaeon]|nr:30S ribosomal protein S6e [Candidatus Diapherotrites archaeon]